MGFRRFPGSEAVLFYVFFFPEMLPLLSVAASRNPIHNDRTPTMAISRKLFIFPVLRRVFCKQNNASEMRGDRLSVSLPIITGGLLPTEKEQHQALPRPT